VLGKGEENRGQISYGKKAKKKKGGTMGVDSRERMKGAMETR